MKQILYNIFFIFGLSILMSACGKPSLKPEEVALHFWEAVAQKNKEVVLHHILPKDYDKVDFKGYIARVYGAGFGKAIVNKERAVVITDVHISGHSMSVMNIETVLLLEGKEWKVDYEKTVAKLKAKNGLDDLVESLQELGGLFSETINQSVQQLKKELPRIKNEVESTKELLEEQLPKMKQTVDQFRQSLEEALKSIEDSQNHNSDNDK